MHIKLVVNVQLSAVLRIIGFSLYCLAHCILIPLVMHVSILTISYDPVDNVSFHCCSFWGMSVWQLFETVCCTSEVAFHLNWPHLRSVLCNLHMHLNNLAFDTLVWMSWFKSGFSLHSFDSGLVCKLCVTDLLMKSVSYRYGNGAAWELSPTLGMQHPVSAFSWPRFYCRLRHSSTCG
jgi:hypothetical protein